MDPEIVTLKRTQLPQVTPVGESLTSELQHKLDNLTKPPGSLGRLEALAAQLGAVQNTLAPTVSQPTIVVIAADHGLATTGVSPYPQEVTAQMVANFLNGGAAINVLAEAHGIALKIVDAGVAHPIPGDAKPEDARLGAGTANMLETSALTEAQLNDALAHGDRLARDVRRTGANVIGFGEMGIGNTSAAALITHFLTGAPLSECTGRGTGLDDAGLARKLSVLEQVAERARASGLPENPADAPHAVLRECGGFEIAMIAGAMVRAASERLSVVVDGFIATAAFLAAHAMRPNVLDYAVFAHRSEERGHAVQLEFLNAEPLLAMNMRLGEGTGAALAMPLLRSSAALLNQMASFESAGVSDRPDEG